MFTTISAEFISFVIALFIVYMVSVTVAGIFRTWVAHKVGDDTAIEHGFLTLDPFKHMSVVSLMFLLMPMLRLVVSASPPIDPHNIEAPGRYGKIFLAYFSDTLMHFIVAFVSLVGLLWLFGYGGISMVYMQMFEGNVSHSDIARHFPALSSLSVSVGYLFVLAVYLNMILAMLGIFFDGIDVFVYILTEKYPVRFAWLSQLFSGYGRLIIPLIISIFFGSFLLLLTLKLLSIAAIFIAQWCYLV